MKFGSGALLVAAGLLVLWLAVSGRLTNIGAAWSALNGGASVASAGGALPPMAQLGGAAFPVEALPPLPVVVPGLS